MYMYRAHTLFSVHQSASSEFPIALCLGHSKLILYYTIGMFGKPYLHTLECSGVPFGVCPGVAILLYSVIGFEKRDKFVHRYV